MYSSFASSREKDVIDRSLSDFIAVSITFADVLRRADTGTSM